MLGDEVVPDRPGMWCTAGTGRISPVEHGRDHSVYGRIMGGRDPPPARPPLTPRAQPYPVAPIHPTPCSDTRTRPVTSITTGRTFPA